MRGVAAVRRLVRSRQYAAVVSSCSRAEMMSLNPCNRSSLLSSMVTPTTSASIAGFMSSTSSYRSFCASSSGPSNIVVIESEDQLNTTLKKVQDESLPAVFYFTAVWCGPCKLLYPVVEGLSQKYPNVTTYKIDIDQEGLENALSKLDIHSVPTLNLYHDGKMKDQVIGAKSQELKDAMEKLYNSPI